jgi:3',5'-cyclic AMP phosphodiesterase CpdA
MIQRVNQNGFSVVWWSRAGQRYVVAVRGGDGTESHFQARDDGGRYEACIAGVPAGRSCHYAIGIDSRNGFNKVYESTVRTAGVNSDPVSFAVVADSGSGGTVQRRLAGAVVHYPVDLLLHAGDIVHGRPDIKGYQRMLLEPYSKVFGHVPVFPVLGNHDVVGDGGCSFCKVFSLPENGPGGVSAEHCYWFDYGCVRFVMVDSNLSEKILSEVVAPWMRSVLQGCPVSWKVVCFHHPPYTGGVSHKPSYKIRHSLVSVMDESGVDLVFCGHNHLYERTLKLRAGHENSAGIIYLTVGAGESLHPERSDAPEYIAAYNDSLPSFCWVNASTSCLSFMQIGVDDSILDEIVLKKHGDRL